MNEKWKEEVQQDSAPISKCKIRGLYGPRTVKIAFKQNIAN